MRNQMQNWLSEIFGMDTILRPTTLGGTLIDGRFDYWTVSGLLADFVLVTPKPGVRNPSVLETARLIYEVRSLTHRWVAYGCLSLSAVERERLLCRQTAFVVAGRQVFLPFFGIALRADPAASARNWLGGTAQALLLAALEGQLSGPLRNRAVIHQTGSSRASAFRALAELRSFGLIERTPQGFTFIPNVQQVFRFSQPRLRKSPVRDALIAKAYCTNYN